MRKLYVFTVLILVVLCAAGAVGYAAYRHNHQSDVYIDKGGCAESRGGGIHPDFCVLQRH